MKPFRDKFDFIFYAFGCPYADYSLDNSGNVIPNFEHDSFKEGMKYIKKLWDENLIEKEFTLNDVQSMENKFFQSKFGVVPEWLFRNYNRIQTSLQSVNPDGKLGFMDPPEGLDGKKGMRGQSRGGIITSITNACKNPEKASKFIEFLVSPEGRDLLQLGIEGTHYTKQDGKIIYNEDERAKDQFSPNGWAHPLAWVSVIAPIDAKYLPETEPQRQKALESVDVATRNIVPNLIPVNVDSQVELGSVLGDIFDQYFIEMLTGKIDIDKGVDELSKKWRQQGGDKVLQEASELYKKYKK